jgi:hypothetical protein
VNATDPHPTTASIPWWQCALAIGWVAVLIVILYERTTASYAPAVIAVIAGLFAALAVAVTLWQRHRGVRVSAANAPTAETTFLYAMAAILMLGVPSGGTNLFFVVQMLAALTTLSVGASTYVARRQSERS